MFEKLSRSNKNNLGILIRNKITLDEELALINEIESILKNYTKANILVIIEKGSSWELKAGIEDFKWAFHNIHKINKLAFISEDKFWDVFMGISKPFFKISKIKEKKFSSKDVNSAWLWLEDLKN